MTNQIFDWLERLAELFPDQGYQVRLENFLKNKSITDTAQLEVYLNEFHRLETSRGHG